jgi:hypothetical protein
VKCSQLIIVIRLRRIVDDEEDVGKHDRRNRREKEQSLFAAQT